MTVDEMIKALRKEQREEAWKMVSEGKVTNLAEAYVKAGTMEVLQTRQGSAEKVVVWGVKDYSFRGHLQRGVYVGAEY